MYVLSKVKKKKKRKKKILLIKFCLVVPKTVSFNCLSSSYCSKITEHPYTFVGTNTISFFQENRPILSSVIETDARMKLDHKTVGVT